MSNQVLFVLFPGRPKYKCSHGLDPVLIYHVDEHEMWLSCGAVDCVPSREFLSRVTVIACDTEERLKEYSDRLKESGAARPVCELN